MSPLKDTSSSKAAFSSQATFSSHVEILFLTWATFPFSQRMDCMPLLPTVSTNFMGDLWMSDPTKGVLQVARWQIAESSERVDNLVSGSACPI